jgi:hypothetical protein
MASRKETLLREQIKPLKPEDWHIAEVVDPNPHSRAVPFPTGLSDEEDAHRHLAIRFNAMFCTNCEAYYDADHEFCNACSMRLRPVGTPPMKRKIRPL